jgi:hypothetical protein
MTLVIDLPENFFDEPDLPPGVWACEADRLVHEAAMKIHPGFADPWPQQILFTIIEGRSRRPYDPYWIEPNWLAVPAWHEAIHKSLHEIGFPMPDASGRMNIL